ncbi:hypothetical protein ACOMHN_013161 [Nucella lapillus]
MDDQKYRKVVHFLSSTEKKYPEYMYSMSDERKRSVVKSNFRQFAASYKLKSAVLVHSKTEKEVIQKSRVNAILQACHDNPTTGGHFGRDKTMLKITERFHWKGMKKDVRDYIKNCKKMLCSQREDGFRGSSIELHFCSKEGLESRRH